jgi:hypothetical protein
VSLLLTTISAQNTINGRVNGRAHTPDYLEFEPGTHLKYLVLPDCHTAWLTILQKSKEHP